MGFSCSSTGYASDHARSVRLRTITGSSALSTFTDSGTVSGLAIGASFALSDNGADRFVVPRNGSFTLQTPMAANGSYDVMISIQPNGEIRAITNASDREYRRT